jgi:copper oxidase (laccase) domain-containing protein
MNILNYVDIQTSTKEDGNMALSYGKEQQVRENRRVFWEKKGFKYENTYLMRTDFENLKELNNVEIVKHKPSKLTVVSNTDALITSNKDVVLALLTGDCLQITVYDPKHRVLSLIHAGFRWQNAGIIDNTFEKLTSEFSTDPKDVLIHLGNCISPRFYRWDRNILDITDKKSWIRKTMVEDNHPERPYIIDLRKSAILNLKEIGILDKNIFDTKLDCYINNYFSHVKSVFTEEKDGRHITLVQIK